jgi:hypothetical protein
MNRDDDRQRDRRSPEDDDAGSSGNWISRTPRSGSFGELGGQGFLGGGPTSGPLGGGHGRDEWAGVGSHGTDRSRGESAHPSGVSHAGRGPKGYRRSDERIEEEINERLTRHPGIDATDIEVMVKSGEVRLSGTVDSRQTKRLAQDLAADVYGVSNVQNLLRTSSRQPIQAPRERPSSSASSRTSKRASKGLGRGSGRRR